ncbi:hypothetical protein IAR50_000984 [Cryptococcus sp. DSM 104548]
MLALGPFQDFSGTMQWQNYAYNGPLTPELERSFKKEASRALSRSSGTPLGFSVSTSITTVNGVTRGSTEFQVGKGTPWTSEEKKILDEKFARLAPDGKMIGPDGRPLYPENGTQITAIKDTPHQPKAILPPPSAAHTHTAHNAHQLQAAVPSHAYIPSAHTTGSSAGGAVHRQDYAYAYPSPVSPGTGAGYRNVQASAGTVVSSAVPSSGSGSGSRGTKKSSRHKVSDPQAPGLVHAHTQQHDPVSSGHGHQERRGLAAADTAGREHAHSHVPTSSHKGSSQMFQTDRYHHSPRPHRAAPALVPITANPVHPVHPSHHHQNHEHAHFTPTASEKKHGHYGGISSYPAQPTAASGAGVAGAGMEKPLPPPPEARTRHKLSRSEGGGGNLEKWTSRFTTTKRGGAV